MPPSGTRNITRYTYARTAFQGWRVSIGRNRHQLTRYFSDKVYGGEEESFAAALALRDRVLEELNAAPENARNILAQFAAAAPLPRQKQRREAGN